MKKIIILLLSIVILAQADARFLKKKEKKESKEYSVEKEILKKQIEKNLKKEIEKIQNMINQQTEQTNFIDNGKIKVEPATSIKVWIPPKRLGDIYVPGYYEYYIVKPARLQGSSK